MTTLFGLSKSSMVFQLGCDETEPCVHSPHIRVQYVHKGEFRKQYIHHLMFILRPWHRVACKPQQCVIGEPKIATYTKLLAHKPSHPTGDTTLVALQATFRNLITLQTLQRDWFDTYCVFLCHHVLHKKKRKNYYFRSLTMHEYTTATGLRKSPDK